MGLVKIGRNNVVIPPGSSEIIRGVVHAEVTRDKMQLLFVPDLNFQADGILEMNKTLVTLKRGYSCTVGIMMQNPTLR